MQKVLKKKGKPSALSRVPYKRRNESEMIKIVTEINSGLIGKRAACQKYGLNRNTLARFIRQYVLRSLGNEISTQTFATMTDDKKLILLENKVKELTKLLAHANLKHDSLQIMIKVAEEDLNIKIRKKRGTKQSKE